MPAVSIPDWQHEQLPMETVMRFTVRSPRSRLLSLYIEQHALEVENLDV